MELKPRTIRHLQDYVSGKISERGFEDETLHERLLLLAEEVGELIHACRKTAGMNVDQHREIPDKVGEELADVINMTFAVAAKAGIDVEKEFVSKEKIIDKRSYARSTGK